MSRDTVNAAARTPQAHVPNNSLVLWHDGPHATSTHANRRHTSRNTKNCLQLEHFILTFWYIKSWEQTNIRWTPREQPYEKDHSKDSWKSNISSYLAGRFLYGGISKRHPTPHNHTNGDNFNTSQGYFEEIGQMNWAEVFSCRQRKSSLYFIK